MREKEWTWWAYSMLLCSLGFGRMFERLARESGGFWSQFGPPLGALVVSIGIVCWRRKIPFLSIWLWRLATGCTGLALLIGVVFSAHLFFIGVPFPATLMLAACVVGCPALLALWRYAFRSPDLWTRR